MITFLSTFTGRSAGYLLTSVEIVIGLDAWFSERLKGLDCRPETEAYVVGVLKEQARPRDGSSLAGRSIVLAYHEARKRGDFGALQQVGDWILFADVIMPKSIDGEREAIETIGRLAYYSCHRILRYRWDVYEELADRLPDIARLARHKLG